MNRRMYMFDYARLRSFHKGEFSCLLRLLSKLGYNELGLYLEGAFLAKGKAGAVRESALTQDDAEFIMSEAEKCGLRVLPMTNVLYHMEHWLCQERYAHLRRSGPNERYLINFEDPDAIPFALEIIRSLAVMFKTDTVQIGLDEFPFTQEEIPAIGKYIEAIAKQMLAEGLTPAVWSDMFWMEQSLTPYLPRETEIHDWNYYGHRPESLRYFREQGFAQVIAAPSDNGWEGFTGCQRTTGHLRARTDIAVDPAEIEAFLRDAVEEKADGALITNWENTLGRSIWAALVPMARAGLFLQGKWNNDLSEEEQAENALFGRITPYTRIVQELRILQMHVSKKCHIRLPQDALYRRKSILTLLDKPIGFWQDTTELYEEALTRMEDSLSEWTPQGEIEQYAFSAMRSVLTNVRAALALMLFSQSRADYRSAAQVQFTDTELFVKHLSSFENALENAIEGLNASRCAKEESIAETGITRHDIAMQQTLISYLTSISEKLKGFIENATSSVSLPSYSELLNEWNFI